MAHNSSGHPLSSPGWLDIHHWAKLPERVGFARELSQYQPTRIVDLGCGSGLWLDLLDAHLPAKCQFVGIDSDSESIELAERRAHTWSRDSRFYLCDVEREPGAIPKSDLLLFFNLLPYMPNAGRVLRDLRDNGKLGRVVVRQYGIDAMRIGPMPVGDRRVIDDSLHASVERRGEASHHDLDQAYGLAYMSGLTVEKTGFELIQRHAPFQPEFAHYFDETVSWMIERLSDDARARLRAVCGEPGAAVKPLYFAQLEFVAVLSIYS